VPTFGSLFAGIGGFDLGLERAGWTPIWQVENDPFCNKVLKKHWPEVKRYGDIKEVNWDKVERPDLICGGFPCQVVSSAARGRNTGEWMWPWFASAISNLQPRYALVENVPGLLRSKVWDVLGDLSGMGYVAEWATIPASAVGAPHRRTRVWLVAYPYGDGEPTGSFYAKAPELPDSDIYRWSWSSVPGCIRVDDGVPRRVDRLRSLGNAVVPQVAEWIGRRLMEVHEENQ